MNSNRVWLGLLAGSLLASGCARLSPNAFRLSVDKSAPFIIAKTDKSKGWGSVSHPFLCWVSDTRLVATYWIAGDGVPTGTSSMSWPAYTDDSGKTWQFADPFEWEAGQAPETVESFIAEGAQFGRKIPFVMGLFFGAARLNDGTHMAHQHEFSVAKQFQGVGFVKPAGRGHEARVVQYHFPTAWTQFPTTIYISNPGCVNSNDHVFTVAYGRMPGQKHSTYFFKSEDGGKNFHHISTVATPKDSKWGGDGPSEPALALIGGREFFCVMRTGTEGIYGTRRATAMLSARSEDEGATWKLDKMTLPGVMPRMRWLSNGVMICSFGAPGNTIGFSFNGGRSWPIEVAVTRADLKTTGYVDLAEVAPGRLLVLYDQYDSPLESIWLWEPTLINGLLGRFVDFRERF